MSLSSFIDTQEMRYMFRRYFYKPRIPYGKTIKAKLLTDNYFLVGTAFDYLLRFFVEYHNKDKTITTEWIANLGVDFLRTKRQVGIGERIIRDSNECYNAYMSTGVFCNSLAESVLLLAQLEEPYRSGVVVDGFGKVDKKDVQDICNLYSLLEPSMWKVQKVCIQNPIFGRASSIVGAADADLIIDNMLIDIKVVQREGIQRDYFNQILGYLILFSIDGVDELPKEHIIDQLCFYSARYGEMYKYDISTIISTDAFIEFRKWFCDKAIEEYSNAKAIIDEIGLK